MQGLRIRKLADKTTGERLTRYDPETGEKKLVNPATPGEDHEAWPLAGIVLEVAPDVTTVSTSLVASAVAEGWLTAEGGQPVVRAAGPRQDVWASSQTGQPHMFIHYDRLVFHTVDGDVAYRVVRQPDKYADPGDDDTPVTPEVYAAGATRVDHFFVIEMEG